MTTGINSVVVVGSGASVWLAAAALRHAFRHRNLDVLAVETGTAADAPIGRWTLPSLRSLHGLLGIRESDLLKRTGATFKLASEHRDWQGPGTRFLHAHGDIGSSLSGTPFYKYLLLRALAGEPESVNEYSLAATAAAAGRFARPMTNTELTASFTYAFHLPEAAYTAYLREHATRLGVRSMNAQVHDVQLNEGRIEALHLQDGQRIAGDLFLDCSGRDAVLVDRLDDARIDWSAWLPANRMLTAAAPPTSDPPAVTQTLAIDAGWLWQMPLAQARVVGHLYNSSCVADHDAARRLMSATKCAEPKLIELSQGRRRSTWVGNCIALGDTAVQIEPLAGANLHIAELGIAMAIELLPLGADSSLEAVEYNRIMGEFADSLRDFTIAHYRAGRARSGEYWRLARESALPETLAERLDLFRAGGRLEMLDHEIFEETDWAWLLLGSGCQPDAMELHIQSILAAARPEAFAGLRANIQQLAGSMPRHIDYLQHQR